MSRLLVVALVFSLAATTPALAAETLLQSATRAAQALGRTQALSSTNAVEAKGARTGPAVGIDAEALAAAGSRSIGRLQAAQTQQTQPGLESAGLRKRTKIMIIIGAAVGYAAIAYAIDHHVVDNTPSTLGTRKD